MSVYAPLERRLSQTEQDAVTLSFEEIERVLGRKLPQSAYDQRIMRQWWANTDTHSQAKAWLKTGRKARLNVAENQVTFVRDDVGADVSTTASALTSAAKQLVRAVAQDRGVDTAGAMAIVLNEAARARRRAILDWFDGKSTYSETSSAALIREDRDAR